MGTCTSCSSCCRGADTARRNAAATRVQPVLCALIPRQERPAAGAEGAEPFASSKAAASARRRDQAAPAPPEQPRRSPSEAAVVAALALQRYDAELSWELAAGAVAAAAGRAAKGEDPALSPEAAAEAAAIQSAPPPNEACAPQAEPHACAAWMRVDDTGSGMIKHSAAVDLLVQLEPLLPKQRARRLLDAARKAAAASAGGGERKKGQRERGRDKRPSDRVTCDEFLAVCEQLTADPEAAALFERHSLRGAVLAVPDIARFLSEEQGDTMPRSAATVVAACQSRGRCAAAADGTVGVTPDGFAEWLADPEGNGLADPERATKVYHDMSHPLPDYFLCASHASSLTAPPSKSQAHSDRVTELLRGGCRWLELECSDGPSGEPVVRLGGRADGGRAQVRDVLRVVRDNAFASTPFPLILGIELSMSAAQQRRMAAHLRGVLRSALQLGPCAPSALTPEALRSRILIRAKLQPQGGPAPAEQGAAEEREKGKSAAGDGEAKLLSAAVGDLADLVALPDVPYDTEKGGTAADQAAPGCVVSYSGSEFEALAASSEGSAEVAKLTRKLLVRVYPSGGGDGGSGGGAAASVQVAAAYQQGAQAAAIGWQELERSAPLRAHLARFTDNGAAGYLLKPEHLRGSAAARADLYGDARLKVAVLGGRRMPLPPKADRADPYVVLRVCGAAGDDGQDLQTPQVKDNALNPRWGGAPGAERELTLGSPELAVLQVQVRDKHNRDALLGEAALPATCVRHGVRAVQLRGADGADIPGCVLLVRAQWLSGAPPPVVPLLSHGGPESGPAPRRAASVRTQLPASVAAASPLRPSSPGRVLLPGTRVRASWGGYWWPATVVSAGPRSCHVEFEDRTQCTLPIEAVDGAEMPGGSVPRSEVHLSGFAIGSTVLAAWGDEGWFPASVVERRADGTYVVRWADGSGWNLVLGEHMRLIGLAG